MSEYCPPQDVLRDAIPISILQSDAGGGSIALLCAGHSRATAISATNSRCVDMSSVVGTKTHGFAVTDEGKIFVAFANDPDPNGERKHGLYELKATPGSPIASLTAVDGTVTAFDSYKAVPDGTFLQLWGADGNSLVIIGTKEQGLAGNGG